MEGTLSEKLLTVPEVASRLQLSIRTVRNYTKSGALRVVRLGRAVRIDRQDLAIFIASMRSESPVPAPVKI